MTDRYFALTVLLEKDTRDDDAEAIINAILMIKGVADVSPLVANSELWAATNRARNELRDKLWQVLYPKD